MEKNERYEKLRYREKRWIKWGVAVLLLLLLLLPQMPSIAASDLEVDNFPAGDQPETPGVGITSGRYSEYQVFDCWRNPPDPGNLEETQEFRVYNFDCPYYDYKGGEKKLTTEDVSGKIFYFTFVRETDGKAIYRLNMAPKDNFAATKTLSIGRLFALGQQGFFFWTTDGSEKGYFISNGAGGGFNYGGEVTYNPDINGPITKAEADAYIANKTPQYPSDDGAAYDVTFQNADGTTLKTLQVKRPDTFVSKTKFPADPTRQDYLFDRWYIEGSGAERINFVGTDGNNPTGTIIGSDTTVYPQWKRLVSFRAGEGVGTAPDTKTLIDGIGGASFNLPANTFARTGYAPDGWELNGQPYPDGTEYTPGKAETVFTAAWNPTQITIENMESEIKGNQGHAMTVFAPEVKNGTGQVTYRISKTLPAGLVFDEDSGSITGTPTDAGISGTYTITATDDNGTTATSNEFTFNIAETYTVTFDSQGANQPSPIKHVIKQAFIEKPSPDPQKQHYTFDGWYMERSCIYPWNFTEHKVTESITLYAKWTADKFWVTFEGNGNTGGIAPPKMQVSVNDKFNMPINTFEKKGYLFDGWKYGQNTYLVGSEFVMTGNAVTFTAQWKAEKIKIGNMAEHYEANINQNFELNPPVVTGGTGEVTYHIIGVLPEGLELNSETGVISGKPVNHGKSQELKIKVTDKNGSWAESDGFYITVNKTYVVTFDSKGGSPVTAIKDIIRGNSINAPLEPTKENYTFDGWYKDEKYKIKWNFAEDTVSESVTLCAKWKSNRKGWGNISGVVLDEDKKGKKDVTVKLMKGGTQGTQIGTTMITDEDGSFYFESVQNGTYSLVAQSERKVITYIITVYNNEVTAIIEMLSGNRDTILEEGSGAPSMASANLHEMFTDEDIVLSQKGNVSIKLLVNIIAKGKVPVEEKQLIFETLKKDQTVGLYFDIKLLKSIYGAGVDNVTDLKIQPPNDKKVKLVMDVPEALRDKGPYAIIRVHEGQAQVLPAQYNSELFTLAFEADRFSTYAIVHHQSNQDSGDNKEDTDNPGNNENSESNKGSGNVKLQSKSKSPQTGDEESTAGTAIFLAGTAGLLISIILKRKK